MSNHSYNIYYGLHMCHIKDIDKNKITKNLVTNQNVNNRYMNYKMEWTQVFLIIVIQNIKKG